MRRLAPALLVLSLLAVACSSDPGEPETATVPSEATPVPEEQTSTDAQEEPTSEPQPPVEPPPSPTPVPTPEPTPLPTPEAPDLEYVGEGRFQVGTSTITIGSGTARPLTVDIWFPLSDTAGSAEEKARYSFITGDFYESPRALVAEASAMATNGPFPLIVYSHGSGGIRFIHSDYTEVLASHGYIVAAPDHTGNTAVEQFLGIEDDFAEIALNRPQDVRAVIDAITDTTHEVAGPFAAAVDSERVALTGHSFGGFTAYAVVSGYENESGSSLADERVDAIIPLAPAVGAATGATLLTAEVLARVNVPALVMVGTDDKTTPVDPNVERAWQHTTSSPHYRLELVAAEHQSFTDVCDYVAAFEAGQEVTAPVRETIDLFAQAGCADGDMATDRVQELTNTFAIRFLDSVFHGGDMIDPAEVAAIDDIIFASK